MTTLMIRSRPDNVSTRHSPPDNVLVEGNRSTVPPYPSSFLIHHRAIPWHTLATYQWVPYRRLEETSSQQYFPSCAFSRRRDSVHGAVPVAEDIRFIGPIQQQGRGHTGGRGETLLVDKKYAVASGECRMDVKLSCTNQLLLTVQLVLPLLARPGSSSFVFLHVCTSPSPPLALRYGGAGRNSHHVSMYMKSHHDSPSACPRPRQQFV